MVLIVYNKKMGLNTKKCTYTTHFENVVWFLKNVWLKCMTVINRKDNGGLHTVRMTEYVFVLFSLASLMLER
jgi:hypothetical protein